MFLLHLCVLFHLAMLVQMDSPQVYTKSYIDVNLVENNSGAIVTGNYNTIEIGTNSATLKVVGNYYKNINLDDNNALARVTGNYNSIKIETNKATLKVNGNYYKIRVSKGNGQIIYDGNYCCISIGPSVDQNQVITSGNFVEIRRESYNTCPDP